MVTYAEKEVFDLLYIDSDWDTPCTSILLAVERDTPCTSILLVFVVVKGIPTVLHDEKS
jgi:hypothetical protein